MSWSIYAGTELIASSDGIDQDYTVYGIEIDKELNAHGSASFTIPCTHPLFETVKKLGTIITINYNGEETFRGRVAETTKNFRNSIEIYCEGQLAFLCDSLIQPFAFRGTVADFLKLILETHNACVDSERQFQFGKCTVTDPDNNGVLVRSSDSAISCWDVIDGRLVDALGGYILPRRTNGVYYIDYLAEPEKKSTQVIRFGENLLDLEEYMTAEDVVTVLMPFGADIDEDGTNSNSSDQYQDEPQTTSLWHGNRVTIRSVNDGKMYIENKNGVTRWGRIWGTNVWDDVTKPENLLTKAVAWLEENIKSAMTLEISAVDLSNVDVDIDQFHIGEKIRVHSQPHNIDQDMVCTEMHIEPGNPDQNTITLGAAAEKLTSSVSKNYSEIEGKADKDFLSQAVSKVTNSILGASGGCVRVLDTDKDGKIDTLYIADNEDPALASKVWRFNYEGWGASVNGYDGPFTIGATLNDGIVADFITAGNLNAGNINLLGALNAYKDSTHGGSIGYVQGDNGKGTTDGIGATGAGGYTQVVATDSGARISYGDTSQVAATKESINLIVKGKGIGYGGEDFSPYDSSAGNVTLGDSARLWEAVYAASGSIITSDRNMKNSIEYDGLERYLALLKELKPCRFKYNDGTSDRYHMGLISQDVGEALEAVGLSSQEFGGYVVGKDKDGNDRYLLRYDEFMPINTMAIQRLLERVAVLEEKVKELGGINNGDTEI